MPSGSKIVVAVSGVNDVGEGEESFISEYTSECAIKSKLIIAVILCLCLELNMVENVRAESITDTRMQVEWDVVSGATHYLVTTIPSPMQ